MEEREKKSLDKFKKEMVTFKQKLHSKYNRYNKTTEELFFDFKAIKAKQVYYQEEEKKHKVFNHYISESVFTENINNIRGRKYAAKQAIVKLLSNLDKEGFKNALSYAIRHSDSLVALNEKGEEIILDEALKSWDKDFSLKKNAKDVWHLTFSIKESNHEKNLKALQKATQSVLDKNFFSHKYFMVLHTHQNNPHCHIILHKKDIWSERKLHFNSREEIKDFFNTLRNDFAMAMCNQGYTYCNRSRLENDLLKAKNELEANNFESKIVLPEILTKNQEVIHQKMQNIHTKIQAIRHQLEKDYEIRGDLFSQAYEKKREGNKIYFKLFKEAKNHQLRIKSLQHTFKALRSDFSRLQKEFNLVNNTRLTYKNEDYATLQEKKRYVEFLEKNYSKKNLNKGQILLLSNLKKEIVLREGFLSQIMQEKIKSSILVSHLFNKEQNAFLLLKSYKELDSNLEILKKNSFDDKFFEEYHKKLFENKNLIYKLIIQKYNDLEKILTNTPKIQKFNLKEFEALSDFLGKNQEKLITQLNIKVKKQEQSVKDNDNQRKQKENKKKTQEKSKITPQMIETILSWKKELEAKEMLKKEVSKEIQDSNEKEIILVSTPEESHQKETIEPLLSEISASSPQSQSEKVSQSIVSQSLTPTQSVSPALKLSFGEKNEFLDWFLKKQKLQQSYKKFYLEQLNKNQLRDFTKLYQEYQEYKQEKEKTLNQKLSGFRR